MSPWMKPKPYARAKWYLDIAGAASLEAMSRAAGGKPNAYYSPELCSRNMINAKQIARAYEPTCWRLHSRYYFISRPNRLFDSFENRFAAKAATIRRLASRMSLRVELNIEIDSNNEIEPQHDIVVVPPSTIALLTAMKASVLIDVMW